MKPCQSGFPCIYQSHSCDCCLLPQCAVKHVTVEGKDGEYAYDSLTGTLHAWVTVARKPTQPKPDPLDAWYDEFLERNGFAAYKRLMEAENTYEPRRGGIVRQKRVATV